MTIEDRGMPADRGTLVIGTILSVPLFLVVHFVIAAVVAVLYIFFLSVQGGEPNRLVELTAMVISGVLGVSAGRWVCDKAFKAWSGWPVFIVLAAIAALSMVAVALGYGEGAWQSAKDVLALVVGAVAAWFIAVRRVDMF